MNSLQTPGWLSDDCRRRWSETIRWSETEDRDSAGVSKGSPILVFDEAVSNLDTENERKIQESIEQSAQNCTVVMIAHRLSTIKSADRIICMDHGKVAETGTFEELMKKNGYLKKLLENSEDMK